MSKYIPLLMPLKYRLVNGTLKDKNDCTLCGIIHVEAQGNAKVQKCRHVTSILLIAMSSIKVH